MTILGILLVWLVCGFVYGYVIWDDRRTIDARAPRGFEQALRQTYLRRLLLRGLPDHQRHVAERVIMEAVRRDGGRYNLATAEELVVRFTPDISPNEAAGHEIDQIARRAATEAPAFPERIFWEMRDAEIRRRMIGNPTSE